jgi:hypothetical protein
MSKVADLNFRAIEKKREFFLRSATALITIGCKTSGNGSVKNVNSKTTLRSDTLVEASKLPFRKWFLAMAFMSLTKKGMSTK